MIGDYEDVQSKDKYRNTSSKQNFYRVRICLFLEHLHPEHESLTLKNTKSENTKGKECKLDIGHSVIHKHLRNDLCTQHKTVNLFFPMVHHMDFAIIKYIVSQLLAHHIKCQWLYEPFVKLQSLN